MQRVRSHHVRASMCNCNFGISHSLLVSLAATISRSSAMLPRGGGRQGGTSASSLAPAAKRRNQEGDDEGEGSDSERRDASPAPDTRRRGAKRPPSQLAGKSLGRGGEKTLICGRCSVAYVKGEVDWVMVLGSNGKLVATGAACLRCWQPFQTCWQKLGWDWSKVCGKCREDNEFDRNYEITCAISDGSLQPDFPTQSVEQAEATGVEVSVKYALYKEGDPLAQGLYAKQLGEKTVSMPAPWGKGKVHGVLVKHPTTSFIEVKLFHRCSLALAQSRMQASEHLVEDQGRNIVDAERHTYRKTIPTYLRGNVFPPPPGCRTWPSEPMGS